MKKIQQMWGQHSRCNQIIKTKWDKSVANKSTKITLSEFDIILRSESGAHFDELVRSGKVDIMVQQNQKSRANSLRQ